MTPVPRFVPVFTSTVSLERPDVAVAESVKAPRAGSGTDAQRAPLWAASAVTGSRINTFV